MKLEDQCVSLELAKKLKELGIAQKSLFYWSQPLLAPDWHIALSEGDREYCNSDEQYSAFTMGELVEILPAYINDWNLIIKKYPSEYEIKYCATEGLEEAKILKITWDKNLANGLTGMLIHLIKIKLMEVPK